MPPLAGSRPGENSGESRAVAVVDDDPAVRDSLKFLLELIGYSVLLYESAEAFLGSCASGPACLILDQNMPTMTGLELAAQLRASGRAIRVLLVTSTPSAAIILRAAELGIERVVAKPAAEEDLLNFIEAERSEA